MTSQTVFGSLARISDLRSFAYDVERVPNEEWQSGDYVQAEVTGERSELYQIEEIGGVMVPVEAGDIVIGALGHRAATLEGVGSYSAVVGDDLQAMTSAGLFGAFTSLSRFMPRPLSLRYLGHVKRDSRIVRMRDFALQNDIIDFSVPTILIVGTSMSAGKSVTGRLAIAVLSSAGFKVVGAKITGAGRFRDILSFHRCGAHRIYDFVDAGLPSTVVPESEFRNAIRPLLTRINSDKPDFVVVEAGASPLEPYNGAAAISELGSNVVCRILAASDPYSVVGVQAAFEFKPDLVTGPATNTSAGIDLVDKLTGIQAINILDEASVPEFRKLLSRTLGVRVKCTIPPNWKIDAGENRITNRP